jgi:hypothetical protein
MRRVPRCEDADPNRRSPERQGLENVRASPKSAVDENRYSTGSPSDDFRQTFNRSPAACILMAAMIGDDDSVDSVLDGALGQPPGRVSLSGEDSRLYFSSFR